MSKKFLSKTLTGKIPEGPIEAGQTLGMAPEKVLEKYLPNRNGILSILRLYSNLSLSDVARQLDISETELECIEDNDKPVPFQLVPKLASIFRVDLKILLILLGHAKDKDTFPQGKNLNQLPWAAQYSGPELTDQEKVDLQELFKIILAKIKKENM
jgi:transcriptional regulator with XRE-family HTH domain